MFSRVMPFHGRHHLVRAGLDVVFPDAQREIDAVVCRGLRDVLQHLEVLVALRPG